MVDHADLEQLAFRLEQSGDYRILRRVPVVTRYADHDPAAVKRLGLIVDIETTGLDPACDRIIVAQPSSRMTLGEVGSVPRSL